MECDCCKIPLGNQRHVGLVMTQGDHSVDKKLCGFCAQAVETFIEDRGIKSREGIPLGGRFRLDGPFLNMAEYGLVKE